MNQYLLSVHSYDGSPMPPPEVMAAMYRDVEAFNEAVKKAGAFLFGGGLHPPSSATVVRVKDGQALLTDGPYAEAKEHLGGFWILKAPDLDAALAWAKQAAAACRQPVEVRPFQEPAP